MLNIFLDTEQALYWLENARRLNPNIQYIINNNLHTWTEDNSQPRVAVFEVVDFKPEIKQQIQIACDHANLVIVLLPEFITDEWVQEFDHANVVFFISGVLNYSTKFSKVYLNPYFFWSTTDFYHAHPSVLDLLCPNLNQSFDILLGRKKPHRDIIYNTVDHNTNVIRYFLTYDNLDIKQYSPEQFEWPSILTAPQEPITLTSQAVTVNNTLISLSQIIPVDIYNRTQYTVVAESLTDNEFSFFTEKIIKPMIAKRLFIVCAGQHYLRNLRDLGFRTFEGIVNENYDSIESREERTQAACVQVQRLNTLDGNLVQSAAADIVEHNYQHLMNTRWQENLFRDVERVLSKV